MAKHVEAVSGSKRLIVPQQAREGLVVARQMPSRRRRADLHQDWGAFREETDKQFGRINLLEREYPLGKVFSMYGSDEDFKVLSVDLQGVLGTNTDLLVANTFPNPDADFDASYGFHRKVYDNEIFGEAGDVFQQAFTSTQFQEQIQDASKTTIVRSLEGIYNYKGRYEDLPQRLFSDGIRTIMPVHNPDNELGTGHPTKTKDGLSRIGREFVRRCLELGIAMDLSHASTTTSNEILDIIEEKLASGENVPLPLISHTAPYGHAEHTTRAASDKVVVRVAEMGGIIGIVPMKRLVAKDMNNASIVDYVNAMEYTIDLLQRHGIEDPVKHIAIGTDFNGLMTISTIPGLDNIENFTPALDAELAKRGFSEGDQDRILFQNAVDYFSNNLPEAA